MKDYPTYTSVKYYYVDKTVSEKLEFRDWKKDKEIGMCGSLIVTEDGCVYFNQQRGAIITPDSICENRRIIPIEWLNEKQVQYAIDYQPFDLPKKWSDGNAMYSKELWRLVLEDMKIYLRDVKIDIITKDKEYKWIKYE